MKRYIIILSAVIMTAIPSFSQVVDDKGNVVDTTSIYGERADSLEAAVFVSRQAGNYLSKGKDIRTEVISAAGLCKMACCNLAAETEKSDLTCSCNSIRITYCHTCRILKTLGKVTACHFAKTGC